MNAQKKQDQEREKERKGKAGKTKETEIIKLFRGEISRFPLFLFVFSDIIHSWFGDSCCSGANGLLPDCPLTYRIAAILPTFLTRKPAKKKEPWTQGCRRFACHAPAGCLSEPRQSLL